MDKYRDLESKNYVPSRQVQGEGERLKIGVTGVVKVRWRGTGVCKINGWSFCYSGGTKRSKKFGFHTNSYSALHLPNRHHQQTGLQSWHSTGVSRGKLINALSLYTRSSVVNAPLALCAIKYCTQRRTVTQGGGAEKPPPFTFQERLSNPYKNVV